MSFSEFDTIGGIISNLFGRVPKRNETINTNDLTFHVTHADNRRLYSVRVTLESNSESTKHGPRVSEGLFRASNFKTTGYTNWISSAISIASGVEITYSLAPFNYWPLGVLSAGWHVYFCLCKERVFAKRRFSAGYLVWVYLALELLRGFMSAFMSLLMLRRP